MASSTQSCALYFCWAGFEFLGKESESPEKIGAIIDMPSPSDVEGLRRFLGMVTYYSRFLPYNSLTTCPLHLLRKNSRFRWTAPREAVFVKLKREIASERILAPYDPTLPVVLICDASRVGVAGVPSHIIDGPE
jgi:hypothetical protein